VPVPLGDYLARLNEKHRGISVKSDACRLRAGRHRAAWKFFPSARQRDEMRAPDGFRSRTHVEAPHGFDSLSIRTR
jgi:hypothetical protein